MHSTINNTKRPNLTLPPPTSCQSGTGLDETRLCNRAFRGCKIWYEYMTEHWADIWLLAALQFAFALEATGRLA